MTYKHDGQSQQQTSEATRAESELDDLAGILKVGEARRLTQGRRSWSQPDDGGGPCSYWVPVV